VGLHLDVGERGRSEEQGVGEQVVEAAAVAAEDDDPRRAAGDGGQEAELEVGGVLRRRVPLERRALGLHPGQVVGADRVEVADGHVDVEAEGEGVADAAVDADGAGACGDVAQEVLPDGVTAGDDHVHGAAARCVDGFPCAPSAGITRSRFVGSTARHRRSAGQPSSQPGRPSSPDGLVAQRTTTDGRASRRPTGSRAGPAYARGAVDRYQYLLLMGACLLLTFPLELVYGARVWRDPCASCRTLALPAAVFAVWDVLAIRAGVWDFNPRYVTGLAPARSTSRSRRRLLRHHPDLLDPRLRGGAPVARTARPSGRPSAPRATGPVGARSAR
jgi:lycopene cyclase domain-containing protein